MINLGKNGRWADNDDDDDDDDDDDEDDDDDVLSGKDCFKIVHTHSCMMKGGYFLFEMEEISNTNEPNMPLYCSKSNPLGIPHDCMSLLKWQQADRIDSLYIRW